MPLFNYIATARAISRLAGQTPLSPLALAASYFADHAAMRTQRVHLISVNGKPDTYCRAELGADHLASVLRSYQRRYGASAISIRDLSEHAACKLLP